MIPDHHEEEKELVHHWVAGGKRETERGARRSQGDIEIVCVCVWGGGGGGGCER